MKAQSLRHRILNLTLAASAFALSACVGSASMGAPTAQESAAASTGGYAAPAAAAPAADQGAGGEAVTGMYFENYGVNGFVDAKTDNLSTFSVDVDTGAYTLARSYIHDGALPPQDAVRVEEFVNFFDYHYPYPSAEQTFEVYMDAAPSPFSASEQTHLLRVGIQGYDIAAADRKDAALTFVIDVSGSMDMDNRLGLVKRSLLKMVEELRPTDSVGIVVYGSTAWTVLPPTSLAEKQTVLDGINSLQPEGSTNAAEGLRLGYEQAWKSFRPDALNRVILCSDGVANVGITEPGGILETVQQYADKGIYMTSVGVGMGNYNDTLMEQLANDGDGFYTYVDSDRQADQVFLHDLTGTLQTIAKDAKIQVEFNADLVERYRLIGYENRDVADDNFRNDQVDAGEVGAGHSVTALYEVELNPQATNEQIATVYLRWTNPESKEVVEMNRQFTRSQIAASFVDSQLSTQLAVVAAQYAEVLRGSEWAANTSLAAVVSEAQRVRDLLDEQDALDPEVSELVDLLWSASKLADTQANRQQ